MIITARITIGVMTTILKIIMIIIMIMIIDNDNDDNDDYYPARHI